MNRIGMAIVLSVLGFSLVECMLQLVDGRYWMSAALGACSISNAVYFGFWKTRYLREHA